jgi:hypothetical protein
VTPVLDFRAPGTHRRRSTELPAGKDWWNAEQPTEIRRLFHLAGEPGVAVEAYRLRAESAGWQLVEARCSFELRSTSVVLRKSVAGRPATLQVYGRLERPPPDSPRRGILVTITGEEPRQSAQGPDGAGMRRRDVHCLRSFDPASPSLSPPTRLPAGPAEICGLLTLAEARKMVPAVGSVEPNVNAGMACRYRSAQRDQGFGVSAAEQARAFYEDRRSPQDPGEPAFVLFDEDTSGPPEGVWVDTRIGPVRIFGGSAPGRRGLDAAQLVALARLLARR